MPDPEKVYEGKPCERCGETLRWKEGDRCVECRRAAFRRWYARLDGVAYNRLLLDHRRHKALARMAERTNRREQ